MSTTISSLDTLWAQRAARASRQRHAEQHANTARASIGSSRRSQELAAKRKLVAKRKLEHQQRVKSIISSPKGLYFQAAGKARVAASLCGLSKIGIMPPVVSPRPQVGSPLIDSEPPSKPSTTKSRKKDIWGQIFEYEAVQVSSFFVVSFCCSEICLQSIQERDLVRRQVKARQHQFRDALQLQMEAAEEKKKALRESDLDYMKIIMV